MVSGVSIRVMCCQLPSKDSPSVPDSREAGMQRNSLRAIAAASEISSKGGLGYSSHRVPISPDALTHCTLGRKQKTDTTVRTQGGHRE